MTGGGNNEGAHNIRSQQALEVELRAARIVPVIVIKDLAHAVPLARALVEGGLHILEVTLRTPAALGAIRAIAAEVKGAIVGAGTVIDADQFAAAANAGSKFVVSPGLTKEVVRASRNHNVPILPGIASASDIMRGLGMGIFTFKFFSGRKYRRRGRDHGAGRALSAGAPLPHGRRQRQESCQLSVAA